MKESVKSVIRRIEELKECGFDFETKHHRAIFSPESSRFVSIWKSVNFGGIPTSVCMDIEEFVEFIKLSNEALNEQ